MMLEIEEAVAESMRGRGDADVNVLSLREGALARARRTRQRRSIGAVTSLAAVVTAGVLVAPALLPTGPGALHLSAQPSASAQQPGPAVNIAKLPPADGPGAAQQPAAVGTDPAVLHFDLELAGLGASGISWDVQPAVEGAAIWTGSGGDQRKLAELAIGANRDSLLARTFRALSQTNSQPGDPEQSITVAGRPGTIKRFPGGWSNQPAAGKPAPVPAWLLYWQPVDGLWATVEMEAEGAEPVLAVGAALRLDRAQRCSVPFRISALPAGAGWSTCSVTIESRSAGSASWTHSTVRLWHAERGWIDVGLGNITVDRPFQQTHTVAGRPAMWAFEKAGGESVPEGTGTWTLFVPGRQEVNLTISVMDGGRAFGVADVLALADSLTISTDLTDLTTWPGRPVG